MISDKAAHCVCYCKIFRLSIWWTVKSFPFIHSYDKNIIYLGPEPKYTVVLTADARHENSMEILEMSPPILKSLLDITLMSVDFLSAAIAAKDSSIF